MNSDSHIIQQWNDEYQCSCGLTWDIHEDDPHDTAVHATSVVLITPAEYDPATITKGLDRLEGEEVDVASDGFQALHDILDD